MKGLIDSGNEWRSVISKECAERIGPLSDLEPTKYDQVSTAKEGEGMRVLGQYKDDLQLIFPDAKPPFSLPFRPVVLEGLSMDVNLSGPFLSLHGVQHDMKQGKLQIGQKVIPLYSQTEYAGQVMKGSAAEIRTRGTSELLPGHLNQVTVSLPPGVLCDDPEVCLSVRNDQVLSEPYLDWDDGIPRISMLNQTGMTIKIPGGQVIGTLKTKIDEKPKDSVEPDSTVIPKTKAEKEKWITEELKLKSPHADNALRNITKKEWTQVLNLCLDYFDLFSIDGSYGHTTLVYHEIHTTEKAPIKCRSRPINPLLLPSLREQLDDWLAHDVIEPSSSPWCSCLVAVKKKNGKTRWCVDYRALNSVTIMDSYPMPLVDENLAQLAGSRVFSTMDGSGAFHAVPLAEEAKAKTAFTTPWGLFQFKRMPFGLACAPATYSRLVTRALQHLSPREILPFMDDALAHSPSLQEHIKTLRKVFEAHRLAGLKLQPSKCFLFRSQVEYLGHLVCAQGILPVPAYTDVVKNWPMPTNITELRSFLGKTGYYRRFIEHYSKIAAPLLEALGEDNWKDNKERKFPITPEMRKSHQALKNALCQAPILAHPNFESDDPFILDTDWSHDHRSIGGVLSQKQDGQERVIAYGAKKLSVSQANYPPTKGELYAVIFFVKYWRYYLQFRPFVLRTDHQALKWVHNMEAPEGLISRWLDLLANFSFTVKYREGPKHGNADGLSRAPHAMEMTTEEIKADDEVKHSRVAAVGVSSADTVTRLMISPQEAFIDSQETEEKVVSSARDVRIDIRNLDRAVGRGSIKICSLSGVTNLPRTTTEWSEAQQRDSDLRKLREWAKSGSWPDENLQKGLSPYLRRLVSLRSLIEEEASSQLLVVTTPLKPTKKGSQRRLLICPEFLAKSLVNRLHILLGHRSVAAIIAALDAVAYVQNPRRLAEEVVKECLVCTRKRGENVPQRHTYANVPSGAPFQRISIDFVGPLPRSSKGNTLLLTVWDPFTKWLEAIPMPRATAESTARALEKEIFCRYGTVEHIHSDRGTQFTSDLMQDLGELLSIKTTFTPPYHPQSNPVERAHRDLKAGLRAMMEECSSQDWEEVLPQVLFAFRIAPTRTTGHSPFEALFGRDPRVPLTPLVPEPEREKRSLPYHQYVEKLRSRIDAIHHLMRDRLAQVVDQQNRAYSARPVSIEEGSRVWVYKHGPTPTKLEKRWEGPRLVTRIITPTLFEVTSNGKKEMVPIDRLRLYHSSLQHSAFEAQEESDSDDEEDLPTLYRWLGVQSPGDAEEEEGKRRRRASSDSSSSGDDGPSGGPSFTAGNAGGGGGAAVGARAGGPGGATSRASSCPAAASGGNPTGLPPSPAGPSGAGQRGSHLVPTIGPNASGQNPSSTACGLTSAAAGSNQPAGLPAGSQQNLGTGHHGQSHRKRGIPVSRSSSPSRTARDSSAEPTSTIHRGDGRDEGERRDSDDGLFERHPGTSGPHSDGLVSEERPRLRELLPGVQRGQPALQPRGLSRTAPNVPSRAGRVISPHRPPRKILTTHRFREKLKREAGKRAREKIRDQLRPKSPLRAKSPEETLEWDQYDLFPWDEE